jgi:hypothetical protein
MAKSVDERTKELLATISEIVEVPEDVPLPRPTAAQKNELLSGVGNTKELKQTIADILSGRIVTDAISGGQRINLGGETNPGENHGGSSFSSITDFDENEVRATMDALMARADLLDSELTSLKNTIEDKIVKSNVSLTTVTMDTRKDKNLRTAIKRVFGIKTDVVTFEMYKQALELRNRASKEDVEAASDDEVKL